MAISKHTTEQIIAAIRGSAAIKATIAKRLGVHRHTVENYIKNYPTVRQAYIDEEETVSDMGVTKLVEAMQNGDVGTIRWWLARKRRAEYGDNIDLTSDGQALKIVFKYDDSDSDNPDG